MGWTRTLTKDYFFPKPAAQHFIKKSITKHHFKRGKRAAFFKLILTVLSIHLHEDKKEDAMPNIGCSSVYKANINNMYSASAKKGVTHVTLITQVSILVF